MGSQYFEGLIDLFPIDMTDEAELNVISVQVSTQPTVIYAFNCVEVVVNLSRVEGFLLIIFHDQIGTQRPLNERLDNLHLYFYPRREEQNESENHSNYDRHLYILVLFCSYVLQ